MVAFKFKRLGLHGKYLENTWKYWQNSGKTVAKQWQILGKAQAFKHARLLITWDFAV